MRISKVQKQIILILAASFVSGIRSVDTISLRLAVERKEGANLDRANFRKSYLKLVDNELIQRRECRKEVYLNITPAGFDMALEIKEQGNGGK
ncbi:winged helix-turn-helix DNA-binding domainprotein [Vibrio phage 448O51-1]|nr:winged helix-turn-helix DNA-binding domainprotein [Vibrio phage 448O51-1]